MAIFASKKEPHRDDAPSIRLEELPVRLIMPNPDQPRRSFDEGAIAELAASIKQVGLIQPLVVRMADGYFELIAGERRLRAVKLLGCKTVRCIVERDTDPSDAALMAIVENLQREDLHFFEEAECYSSLMERLGLTQEELAARIGKSQSFVANKLRLLKFSPAVRRRIIDEKLSERHARALLRLSSDEERDEAISKIVRGALSVKAADRLVNAMIAQISGTTADKRKPRMIRIFKDYKLFLNTVNTACDQLRESGLNVAVENTDYTNGVEIRIKVWQ